MEHDPSPYREWLATVYEMLELADGQVVTVEQAPLPLPAPRSERAAA